MSTVKQQVTVGGVPLDNTDEKLVITLDDENIVVESKTADSVTYKFLGEATQDTIHTPNVTFTYDGKFKVVQQLKLTQKAKPLVLNTEWQTVDSDLQGALANQFKFKITDEQGVPVTGIKKKSITFESIPRSTSQILPGNSDNLAEDGEGVYYVTGNLGHVAGQITIDLVLTSEGREFTVPTKTYTTPGTPVKVKFTPDTLTNRDPATEVTIEIRQDVYTVPDQLMTGLITSMNFGGGGDTDSALPITVTDGIGKISVVPNGVVMDIGLDGTFTEPADSVRALPRTFAGQIAITEVEDVFTVTPHPDLTQTQVGNRFTVTFKPVLNGMPYAQYVHIDEARSSLPSNVTLISQGAANGTDYNFLFEAIGEEAQSGVICFVRNDAPTEGAEQDKHFAAATFYVISEAATGFTVDFDDVVTSTVNLYKGVTFYPKYNGVDWSNKSSIDRLTSNFGSNYDILNTGSLQNGGYQLVIKHTEVGNRNLSINMVRDSKPSNGVIGEDRFVCNFTMQTRAAGKVIDITGLTKNVGGHVGQEVPINMNLKIDGVAIDPADTSVDYGFIEEWIQFVSRTETGIIVRIVKVPTKEVEYQDINLNVTKGDAVGTAEIRVIVQTDKPKPALVNGGSVTDTLGSTGKLPITVSQLGEDLTPQLENYTITDNEYITVDQDGNYTVIKADAADSAHNLVVSFNLNHNGITWKYSAAITFNVLGQPRIDNMVDIPLELWAESPVVFDVMLGETKLNQFVTELTVGEATAGWSDWLEFYRKDTGRWYFKAIKSDKNDVTSFQIDLNFKLTYQGHDYTMKSHLKVAIGYNNGVIPENRFNIEFL